LAYESLLKFRKPWQNDAYHADMNDLQESAELPAMERSAALKTLASRQPATRMAFWVVAAHCGKFTQIVDINVPETSFETMSWVTLSGLWNHSNKLPLPPWASAAAPVSPIAVWESGKGVGL
jgi:hypothetical protein